MKLNRYEIVKRVINKLDNRIFKFLNDDNLNSKELISLMEMRSMYIKELDGLTRSMNTKKMYEKKK